MVTTGGPDPSARKTEVIDVLSGETCADLADFPFENVVAGSSVIEKQPKPVLLTVQMSLPINDLT